MKLSELKSGEKGVIVRIKGYGGFRKRIVEMGFIKGKVVTVLRNAPLQDPIEYAVMDYKVSLRRQEAANIEVITQEEAQKEALESADSSFHGTLNEEELRTYVLRNKKEISVALVGNPNCGKTSLFNVLTDGKERVGNYSGVTVDSTDGHLHYKGYDITVVDLPGTYSLTAYSPEERYVRQYIVDKKPDIIINVVDSSNLERNLYLTTQLIDMNVRTVVALNMFDELEQRGDTFDYESLSKMIGIPMVPTISPKRFGVDRLFDVVIRMSEGSDLVDKNGELISSITNDEWFDQYLHKVDIPHKHKGDTGEDLIKKDALFQVHRHIHINYGKTLEKCIAAIKRTITFNDCVAVDYTPRYMAIKLLENDADMLEYIQRFSNVGRITKEVERSQKLIQERERDHSENVIMDSKYGFIAGALKETYFPAKRPETTTRSERVDHWVTHKYLGYPLFFAILFFMFWATFNLGAYPMDWIDQGVSYIGGIVSSMMNPGMLRDLLVKGIIGGVGGVLVFLPNILILYFGITFMESSGYMARAAFLMDKIMHKIGLHGRSFIPLVMGFGCNVPAIMASRTIENRNSRMVTILITPLMSCSARLPIYILIAGTFFPKHATLVLMSMYVVGILLAALLSIIFKKLIFKKEETPFVMELPPYRIPSFKSMLRDTWEKCLNYLQKIATTILVGSIIIWVLSYFPRTQEVKDNPQPTTEQLMHQQEQSYLAQIGHFIEPAFRPLGFDWRMDVALLSGLTAKEIVVSTVGVLFGEDTSNGNANLAQRLQEAQRIDGTPLFTPAVALSFMLFVLIYFPCIATLGSIRQETGSWWWALFVVAYTLVLAWGVAYGAYQLLENQWIEEALVVFIVGFAVLYASVKVINTFRLKAVQKTCGHACSNCSLYNQCGKK